MKATVEEKRRGTVSSPGRDTLPGPMMGVSVDVKTILVPLDFSRTAMYALDYAWALAKQLKSQVHLMHVQLPDEACAVPGAAHLMRECAESVTFLHQRLGQLDGERGPRFWPENCHIRTGHPYQEICNLAKELNVDLIVLGSRGNVGLKRVLLGSTAERVVRFSPCPVLVVHQRKKGKIFDRSAKKFPIRKIVAPIDFSQCSMKGAMYAAFLAREFDAKLCLFHSVQLPAKAIIDRLSPDPLATTNRMSVKNARLEMQAFRQLDFFRGVKTAGEVRTGYPIEEIYAETKRPDTDLVVISTHGRSGFDRMLLGSVAEHAVRYAECPVLVVPSRDAGSA